MEEYDDIVLSECYGSSRCSRSKMLLNLAQDMLSLGEKYSRAWGPLEDLAE